MKTPELNAIASRLLLSRLPGFTYARRMLLMPPLTPIVRGIFLDGSDHNKRLIRPTVFVQPLYVPAEEIHFTFSLYLNGNVGEWWDFGKGDSDAIWIELTDAIKQDAMPFLERLGTPEMLALHGAYERTLSSRCHLLEAVAYSRAYIHNWNEAALTLSELRQELTTPKSLRHWELALLDRADRMEIALDEGAEAVDRLLDEWCQQSIQALS